MPSRLRSKPLKRRECTVGWRNSASRVTFTTRAARCERAEVNRCSCVPISARCCVSRNQRSPVEIRPGFRWQRRNAACCRIAPHRAVQKCFASWMWRSPESASRPCVKERRALVSFKFGRSASGDPGILSGCAKINVHGFRDAKDERARILQPPLHVRNYKMHTETPVVRR